MVVVSLEIWHWLWAAPSEGAALLGGRAATVVRGLPPLVKGPGVFTQAPLSAALCGSEGLCSHKFCVQHLEIQTC